VTDREKQQERKPEATEDKAARTRRPGRKRYAAPGLVEYGPIGKLTRAGSATVGDAGAMTGFMMQRGRMVLCGNVGPGLGDSMYDGTIYVGGTVKALGIDCVPGEWTDADTEFIERKFRIYGLGSPPEFQKFVCGKKLYNYDNLEPAERKLVL